MAGHGAAPHKKPQRGEAAAKFKKQFCEVNLSAEGEKTICYIVFDGFRRLTPDFAEPNGDGKITVSTSYEAKKLPFRRNL